MPPTQSNVPDTSPQAASVPPDKVWISREEYDRLRQAEQSASAGAVPYVSAATVNNEASLRTIKRQQIIVGGVIAAVCILGLIVPGLQPLAGLAIPVFLVLAIIGIIQYFRAKHRAAQGKAVVPHSTGRLILIIVTTIVAVPVIAGGAMILLLIILFSSGAAQGS